LPGDRFDDMAFRDPAPGAAVNCLRELGVAGDTIVVFASDNGLDGPGPRPIGGKGSVKG
jgi:arylsulfatase A-like enzyme